MTPRLPSPEFAARLARAGLLAFYSAIALLGSGGLHAVAPGCQSGCCAAPAPAAHAHQGCTHHHHHSAPQRPRQQEAPGHCPEGCLICEFAATPAVPVALVILPPQQERVETVTPACELGQPCDSAPSFWIRGPPVLG